jgi:SAM-dependent methyltransferase
MQFLIILAIVFVLYIIWKYWALLLGAGYDPTPIDRVYKMLDMAQVNENDIVYDLGSGDGRILITAAKRYGARAVGIEADPFRFIFSWLNILFSGQSKKIKLKFGNFFKKKISNATIITVFLYRPTNNKLKEKFLKELKPGTRVVSYIWTFDNWELEDCLPEDRIYLYIIKKAEEGR